jgi:glycosyltransferase involved in cell wall biosynthesis
MKLLFVHERFGAFAGAEINAFHTANALKQRCHTLGLLHGAHTGKEEERWRETFTNCFALPARGTARAAADAIARFDPDVIYVHKMADLGVIRALVQSRRPTVHMVHDHDLYCMRSYKYHPLTRRICNRPVSPFCIFPCGAMLVRDRSRAWPFKWVSYLAKRRELRLNRCFDRLVVATDYMRQELVRNGFDDRRIEIHPPVPNAFAAPRHASFSDRNLILYAGQIIRGKGVDVLLESLAQVRQPFECIILGEGSHRAYCEELSRRLVLADRVHFKGFVPRQEFLNYYCDGSAAVMSSVWPEPFGAAGLEAMRFGLPVVAFDAGGIREWLVDGHNGFLAPWMDRAAFAARVECLLADKELGRAMGSRGRRLLCERYSFEVYIRNLENMFTRVIAEAEMHAPA